MGTSLSSAERLEQRSEGEGEHGQVHGNEMNTQWT